jgi:hypothetical protein
VLVAVYFAVAVGLYNALYLLDGYLFWDSTVIHTPQVIPRFILTTVVPGTVGLYVVLRLSMLPYKKWVRRRCIVRGHG